MMFGSWGNPDREESARIIHAALDAGINFIDRADVYSAGESEEIVGAALAGRRDDVVLATKFHGTMGPDQNERGNSRRWIALDRVDEIVPPGVNLNPADAGWQNPALEPAARRR
jgi:aryl-alcohol dehydrogenase-like predicted oxidoreductase